MGILRDVALAIRLNIDRSQLAATQAQLQAALQQGTAPAGAIANLTRIEGRIDTLTRRIQGMGVALVVAFGGRMVVNFLEQSVMMFAKFDQKLQQSISIMDKVSPAMREKMSDTAREVAKEVNISADQIAEGFYHLASAGMNAQQSIAALPIVALFAKAGLMSVGDAAAKLTQAVSALGYESKNPQDQLASMARVADVLSLAANKSKANIEEFATALNNKAAQSLRIFNKDVEEGVAVLAMMADAGVKGAVAGERLDIFIRQITNAAIKNKEAFKLHNIEVFDKTTGKMKDFADISHSLTAALGGLSDRGLTVALSQLGIQQRTQAALKMFIGAEQAIRDYEKMLDKAGGTTKRVADEQLKSAAEQFGILQKKVDDARMSIGQALIPALLQAGGALGDEDSPTSVIGQLKAFAAWIKDNQEGIGSLGSMIVWLATKPLMYLFDAFNAIADLIVGTLNIAFGSIAGALTFISVVAELATHSLAEFLKWVGLKSAGDAVEDLAKKLDGLSTVLGKFTKDRFETAGQNFADLWKTLTKDPFEGAGPHKPRLVDAPITGHSGRGNKPPPRPDPEDPPSKDDKAAKKADDKREKEIERLNNRLAEMTAKHTQDRVDDELQKLKELEDGYKKVYGTNIPKAVEKGLEAMKADVKQHGASLHALDALEAAYKKVYGTNIPADVKAGLDKIKAALTGERTALNGLKMIEDAFKKIYGDKIPVDVKDGLAKANTAIRSGEPVAQSTLNTIEAAFKKTYGDHIPASVRKAMADIRAMTGGDANAMTEKSLKDLEKLYATTYGDKIPKEIKASLKQMRDTIKNEGAANATKDMFEDLFKDGVLPEDEVIPQLQAFIKHVQDLKDKAKEGSKEWKIYADVLEKAIAMMTKEAEKEQAKGAKNKKFDDDERVRKQIEQLRKIESIANHVANSMERGFSNAMHVLFEGSKRGADAMEQLGRATLAAMISPLAEYAMMKAKHDFIRAGEEIAEGVAAASNPFTSWEAGGHFAAAAKFAAMGAAWGAFGGIAAGGADMIGNSNHGMGSGNASDTGRNQVDNSTPLPPEINIYVDGVDPSNPRHQQLVGQTAQQWTQRTGGAPSGSTVPRVMTTLNRFAKKRGM